MPRVLGKHIGLDPAGRNRIDGNPLGPRIGCKPTCEGLDRGLGAAVDGMIGHVGDGRGDGGHEDDAAAAGDVAEGVLGDEELGARVEAEDGVEVGFCDVLLGAEDLAAGVGDDDVEAAEVGERLVEEVRYLGDFGHVGLDGDSFAAGRLDRRHHFVRGRGAVGVVDDDAGAAFAELEGHGGAEAAAGAGYQGNFAVKAGGGLLGHDGLEGSGEGGCEFE